MLSGTAVIRNWEQNQLKRHREYWNEQNRESDSENQMLTAINRDKFGELMINTINLFFLSIINEQLAI